MSENVLKNICNMSEKYMKTHSKLRKENNNM